MANVRPYKQAKDLIAGDKVEGPQIFADSGTIESIEPFTGNMVKVNYEGGTFVLRRPDYRYWLAIPTPTVNKNK